MSKSRAPTASSTTTPTKNANSTGNGPFTSPYKTPLQSPNRHRRVSPIIKQLGHVRSLLVRFFLSDIIFYLSLALVVLTAGILSVKIGPTIIRPVHCKDNQRRVKNECIDKGSENYEAYVLSSKLRNVIYAKPNITTIQELSVEVGITDLEKIRKSIYYTDDVESFDDKIIVKISTRKEIVTVTIVFVVYLTMLITSIIFRMKNQ